VPRDDAQRRLVIALKPTKLNGEQATAAATEHAFEDREKMMTLIHDSDRSSR